MPLSSKSSLTWPIHLFLCLPLLLSPLTCPCSAALGSFLPSILSTCPNHSSLLLLIFSITVSSASCFLFSNSFSSASASDPSQPRHFCLQKSSIVFFPQCPALRPDLPLS